MKLWRTAEWLFLIATLVLSATSLRDWAPYTSGAFLALALGRQWLTSRSVQCPALGSECPLGYCRDERECALPILRHTIAARDIQPCPVCQPKEPRP